MMKLSAAGLAWRRESAIGRLFSRFCCRVATEPKHESRRVLPSAESERMTYALLLDFQRLPTRRDLNDVRPTQEKVQ
jgi:hypothetical protein